MPPKKKIFVIIDGNALIHRAFHALPPLTTKRGVQVNAVYGFTTVLLRMFRELKPDYWAATFDLAGPTFRHKAYDEYKATRVKAPQELYDQIPLVKQVVQAFHIPVFEKEGFEADDLIGTLVKLKTPTERIIVTGDNDTLQLVEPDIKVFTLRKGVGDTVLVDEAGVKEKYGLVPDQLVDLKALRGDTSDNIPGIKGIGEKTAVILLQTFGTLDAVYRALERNDTKLSVVSERIQNLLREGKASADLSKMLGQIDTAVPIEFSLEQCAVQQYDRTEVVRLFQELEFTSLLNKLPKNEADAASAEPVKSIQQSVFDEVVAASTKRKTESQANYQLVDTVDKLEHLVEKLKAAKELSVDTETTDTDAWRAELLGISVAWQPGEAYYVALGAHPELRSSKPFAEFAKVLIDPKLPKVGHNMKYDLAVLERAGLGLAPLSFDTMIAAYLLNPGFRRYGLDDQVFTEFGYEMQPIEALIGPKGKNQKNMREVPIGDVAWYSGEDADWTLRLKQALAPRLAAQSIGGLFETMEMPLVGVLEGVERNGVKIDSDFLRAMSKTLGKRLAVLETKVHKLAGTEFNLQSPTQLKDVLFERLKLETKGIGKTKTGLSTAASELEKMKDLHPIIPLMVEFREMAKLKNTYLDTLPLLVNPETGRVHTSFNQTIAATGRLSSVDPNLQNIPIRTELGNEIRKAFIADRGNRLVSVDYSQIELRVIASVANDPAMIETFARGEDIHTTTAAAIHEVPLKEVTKELRRTAKAVNFGVIYGLGPVGLAEQQGITRDKAKEFIAKYFAAYPKVKEWIDETKLLARSQGYVETLFGRRRYLPEIVSPNHMLQAQAERIAVNMPIQGTAADLMKLAMLKVADELPKKFPKARMLLQVHDELVLEAPAAEAEAVGQLVSELMVSVAKLRVPITAEVEVGMNWGSLKEV
jgi:DNA polymerase-1